MKLLYQKTRIEFIAEILEVEEKDYATIKKSKQFEFDWSEEKENNVFKIVKKDSAPNQEILGLISLINFTDELRMHVSLLESSKDNKGKNKKVDRIAGCLLAFAARLSFEKGYYGFTSLVPKTQLIDFYIKKYGFEQYGRQLAVDGQSAINLIEKYL